jgi:hypothetical protein
MIINNFFNKIKGKYSIDNITIMYLFVIVGVGVSSFLLGRISVESNQVKNSGISIVDTSTLKGQALANKIDLNTDKDINNTNKERVYVASKNGKLYYPVSCNGAKRISEKNKVWFSSQSEAEKMGYTVSSNCK